MTQNNLNSEMTSLLNNGENRTNANNEFQNCNLMNISHSNENNTANPNNNLFSNSFYKEQGTQTDLALNSMLMKESQ